MQCPYCDSEDILFKHEDLTRTHYKCLNPECKEKFSTVNKNNVARAAGVGALTLLGFYNGRRNDGVGDA